MQLSFETFDSRVYLFVEYRISASAIGTTVSLETSTNLVDWSASFPGTQLISSRQEIEGVITLKRRLLAPADTLPQQFLQLRISGVP